MPTGRPHGRIRSASVCRRPVPSATPSPRTASCTCQETTTDRPPEEARSDTRLFSGEEAIAWGNGLLDHEVDEEDFGTLLFLGQDRVDAPLEFLTGTLPADFVIEFINTLGTHGGGDHILDLEDVGKH